MHARHHFTAVLVGSGERICTRGCKRMPLHGSGTAGILHGVAEKTLTCSTGPAKAPRMACGGFAASDCSSASSSRAVRGGAPLCIGSRRALSPPGAAERRPRRSKRTRPWGCSAYAGSSWTPAGLARTARAATAMGMTPPGKADTARLPGAAITSAVSSVQTTLTAPSLYSQTPPQRAAFTGITTSAERQTALCVLCSTHEKHIPQSL